MKFSHALCIAALSTIAAISYAGSAQAISFRINSGVAGPNGETNQGAFAEYLNEKGTRTIDFNDGKLPTKGFAKYSFENGEKSYITSNQWAPVGPNGERNNSKYLAVFNGDKVTIRLEKMLNGFGIDWGAVSANNTFSFYQSGKKGQADTLVKTFTTADILDNKALIRASWQGGQGNGYVYFSSQSNQDYFDKIVISQSSTVGGGFESDNHSFRIADPKDVPEPSIVLGMMAAGSAFLLKRRPQKQV